MRVRKEKDRSKYSRRKVVWDTIEGMCDRQLEAGVAIDRIYTECGGFNTPVGQVIETEKIRDFRKVGNRNLFIAPRPPRNVRSPLAGT